MQPARIISHAYIPGLEYTNVSFVRDKGERAVRGTFVDAPGSLVRADNSGAS
jgi:hypothetical protein